MEKKEIINVDNNNYYSCCQRYYFYGLHSYKCRQANKWSEDYDLTLSNNK